MAFSRFPTRAIGAITAIAAISCTSTKPDASASAVASSPPVPMASAAPSASASAIAPPSATPPEVTRHRFKRRSIFERERFVPAGKVMVVCDDGCVSKNDGARTVPHVTLLERDRETSADFLFPSSPRMEKASYSAFFSGRYPEAFYATLTASGDDTGFFETLRWTGKAWEAAPIPPGLDGAYVPPPLPVREHREALLRAPYLRKTTFFLHGSGGPLLAVPRSGDSYATYVDGKWVERKSPWQPGNEVSAVRLVGGESLVAGTHGAFVLDARGVSIPVTLVDPVGRPEPAALEHVDVVVVADAAWLLVGPATTKRTLAVPADPGTFSVPPSTSPAVSVAPPSASASSAAKPISLPEMGSLDDACKTPFVVLSPASTAEAEQSPDREPYYSFRRTIGNLSTIQDEALFVEIPQAGGRVFGVQTKTKAAVDTLTRAIKLRIPNAAFTVGCLDVRSAIADLDAPPPGVQVFFINLTTGDVVR